MFCKFHFAAMWDSLDVAAQGDCISAVKPKMVFRPMVLPAISFLVGRTDGGHDGVQVSAVTAPSIRAHRGILSVASEMFIFHIFNSVQAFSVVVRRRLSAWSGVCQQPRRAWRLRESE